MASPKSLWLMLVWLLITMGSIIKVSWCLPSCPDNERQALLSFKSGVVNDTTNRLSSWVALPGHDDCCKWKGVGCNNQTGHVVKLDLRNPVTLWYTDDYDDNYDDFFRALDDFNRARLVVRKVNPSLLELKHLNYLDLSMNDFSRINVPNFFGSFHQLRYMNLSWAFFGGVVPHSLGNLSALRSLDLNGIPLNFSLTIPSFPSLLELRLSHSSYDLNPLFHSHLLENLTSLVILDLSDNGFSGPIPNAIRNMSFLQVLDLSYNHFNGSFPKWFYQMKNLKALDLGFNSFTGPIPASSSVAFTSSIETIYMGHNLFNGPLPDWLYLLKNLKTLDLSANGLDGPISTSLGNLSKLEALHLGGNELSGSIPTSLGRLSKLRELYLYNNQLTGPIPMSIGKLSLLTALVLGENHLNGFVPESLGQLSMLTYLNLGNNSLNGVLTEIHFATLFHLIILYLGPNPLSLHLRSGWVPPFQLFWINLAHCDVGPQVPDWLQTQTEMVDITMSNNHITSIPSWFANISSQLQSLDLSHNQIHGKLSNTIFGPRSNLSRLRTLDLSNNSFGGPIPKNIGVMLPDLQFLDISNNHLNGSLPNSLFQMPNLEALDLSRNSLSGSLFSNMSSGIQTIDLRFNRLSGSIPNSIGQLTQLSSLYLSNNNFHGELPPTLQNCSSLSILDVGDNALSGELPTWFGETMLHLKVLRLRSNKYSGSISQKLCRLNRLHILDIAHNHLSGTIPHCFSNFSAMVINITNNYLDDPWSSLDKLTEIIKGRELEYISNLRFLLNIDLSGNNIVGQIPEDLTSLSALTALNLSNNRLTGKIPYTIGRMRSLEALDFSGNQLSGAIPQSISSLSSLSYFNVSCNNLSGAIPTGNQLQTLDDPSIYKSNYALCGYPLKKQCTRDESPVYATSKREEYERDDFKLWLYIGMTSGFVFGFWSFCGTLVFKRTWRYAFIRFVDNMESTLFVAIMVKMVQLKRNFKSTKVEK